MNKDIIIVNDIIKELLNDSSVLNDIEYRAVLGMNAYLKQDLDLGVNK